MLGKKHSRNITQYVSKIVLVYLRIYSTIECVKKCIKAAPGVLEIILSKSKKKEKKLKVY